MGRPPQISREAIIKAATDGKTKPTLKGIADVLGVTPQALYRHVSNFADVQRMIFEERGKLSPFPAYDGESWRDWLVVIAHYLRNAYKGIPRIFEIAPVLPEVAERYETMLSVAKSSGHDEADALVTMRLLVEYVQASVGRERRAESLGLRKQDIEPLSFDDILTSKPANYPLLKKASKGAKKMSIDERFDRSVKALIDGLLMESAPAASKKKRTK